YIQNESNNSVNGIIRSYTLSSLSNTSINTNNHLSQIPLESILSENDEYDGSRLIKIRSLDNNPEFRLSVYGEKKSLSGGTDISNYIIRDVTQLSFQSPDLAMEDDQKLSSMLISNVDNSFVFAGNKRTVIENDSIFIMRGNFEIGAAKDSVDFKLYSPKYFTGVGNTLTDITQSNNGDIYALTVDSQSEEAEAAVSYILKFSFIINNTPIEEASFTIAQTGKIEGKKILYRDRDNALYVLSSVIFPTQETAIELNKISL
ncbi:MAG: hypothetical protein R3321_12400, partial [Nitrososphaeraceae archaeon]|nr:hypothetical protein [Nitrososphaeraceae archaeon]